MLRYKSDVVGENVKHVGWSGLDSEICGVAIVFDRYLSSALHVRTRKAHVYQAASTTKGVKCSAL